MSHPEDGVRLDRSRLNAEGHVRLDDNVSVVSAHPGFDDAPVLERPQEGPYHHREGHFVAKLKDALGIRKGSKQEDSYAPAPVLADVFQPNSKSRLISDYPEHKSYTFKDLVHNPIDTISSKFSKSGEQELAATVVAEEHEHGKEVELIRAGDAVIAAQTTKDKLSANRNLDVLLQEHQHQFVRWTVDRHLTKIRAISNRIEPRKTKEEFVSIDAAGRKYMDWSAYCGYLAWRAAEVYGKEYIGYSNAPLPPSQDVVTPVLERLIVASTPAQRLLTNVRIVYRWERPRLTLACLLTYYALWMSGLIMPGLLFAIICAVLHRKTHVPTLEELKVSVEQTEDDTRTARTITEFIVKNGDDEWVDALISQIGPTLLVQGSDVCDVLELSRNFYEWRNPERTKQSLAILTVLLLVTTFTPTRILVSSTTFFAGVVFFGLWPISAWYPDYRLLVSPVRWLFWKIPTHAQWSIKSLQDEGKRFRAVPSPRSRGAVIDGPANDEMLDFDNDGRSLVLQTSAVSGETEGATFSESDPHGYRGTPTTTAAFEASQTEQTPVPAQAEVDYGRYDCKYGSHLGRLVLSSHGIRFISAIGHDTKFSMSYEELDRLEKMTRKVARIANKLSKQSGEDLRLVDRSGVTYDLANMMDRDQAFSQVVGFTRTHWLVTW